MFFYIARIYFSKKYFFMMDNSVKIGDILYCKSLVLLI